MLRAAGIHPQTSSDAELVLAAYLCWGEACVDHIIGDFAFVIWDAIRRQIFCARDRLGVKPFYYYDGADVFVFASELRALLRHPRVPRAPNEGMIGEYLAFHITGLEETLFQNIYRLPPAHTMCIDRNGIRKRRYWSFDNLPSTSAPKSLEEHVERFRELFDQAVRCRLRVHESVGADLSGGLDSSSVVCSANAILASSAPPRTNLETFSLVFPDRPEADEREYFRELTQQERLASHEVLGSQPDADRDRQDVAYHLDFPYFPNLGMFGGVRALARTNGIRVMLSGIGGDQCMTGMFTHLADLMRAMRIAQAIRQSRDDSRACLRSGLRGRSYSAPLLLLRHGIWPLLPPAARRGVRWLRGREPNGLPPYIRPEFARRIHLTDRWSGTVVDGSRLPTFAQRNIAFSLLCGDSIFQLESAERHTARFEIEYRHPFLDSRLVEYAISLPEDLRCRGSELRFLHRRAMSGLLPPRILHRCTKGNFSYLLPEGLRTLLGGETFESFTIVKLGWVKAESLRKVYDVLVDNYARNNPAYCRLMWPLYGAFGIELWLNTVFDHGYRASSLKCSNMSESSDVDCFA